MRLQIGTKAPHFDLPGVDGKKYSLISFKDKKAIAIIFSCNHCPTVKAYEDRLVAIQAEYKDCGVVLIAINSNDDHAYPEDSFPNMVKRAKQKKFNFPYLRDETQEVARAYGPERTPEVFLLDANHVLVYHGRIDDSEDARYVTKHDFKIALDELLSGKPISQPETTPFGCTVKWKPRR